MTQTAGTRSIPVPNAGVWPGLRSAPHSAFRAAIAKSLVRGAVLKLPIRVVFPDGSWWGGGSADAPRMQLNRPSHFFNRLGVDVKIGFGEAYMVGDWTTAPGTDLADLLTPFAERLQNLIPAPLQRLRGIVESIQPDDEENRIGQAERNIQRHYDLSNELFERFLDPTLVYSSAIFEPGDDLQSAQHRKIESVLDYARTQPGTRLLEIGTGWGQLAIQAAQRGAQVTSVTLSREQRDLALERIADAGVADRVDVQLRDYREVDGQYDAIVSVEMIEAVGERYWPEYFSTIDRLLAPGGRFGLQSILMGHRELMATRRSYTWIHKYIFPGGIIPSAYAIESTLKNHTSMQVLERRDFGRHYARTLRLWRERFNERWTEIRDAGFDETFKRMWNFYLAYCEAGFASRYLSVAQFSIGRDSI